jgi:hypothetical protein
LDAKSGWKLSVNLPPDMPEGPFQHWLAFDVIRPSAEGDGQPPVERLEMPLVGKVLRRITVHGKDIDEDGTIRLGTVVSGSRYEGQYLVKLRDPEMTLGVESVLTSPPSVKASLAPYGDGAQKDLYSLRIEVPPDAPQGVFRGKDAGQVVFTFDHPRVHELRLKLDLVIAPAKRLSSN